MTIKSLFRKKIYFILFASLLLLLGLGLGQQALAANLCTDPTSAGGYGGTCQNITCPTTAGSTPLDSLAADKHAACITEYQGTKKECSTGKCTGSAWSNVCCRAKTAGGGTGACAAPNVCKLAVDCSSDVLEQFTCTDNSKICCLSYTCSNCKATGGCTGNLIPDTANNAACSGTTPACCKVKPAAGGSTPPPPSTTGGASYDLSALSPVGNIDVPTLIGLIIKGALGIVGSIALLMFVYGGFLMLVSQGEATKIQKGKATMVWAAAGLAVIFGSYLFVSYIIAGLSVGGGGGGDGAATTTPKVTCTSGQSCGNPADIGSKWSTCTNPPTGACSSGQFCCTPK